MNKDELISYVKNFCTEHKIDFKVFPGDEAYTVMTQDSCAGFFEHNEKIQATLGIAAGVNDQLFYEVLAHEFGHANQYLENSPHWEAAKLTKEEVKQYSMEVKRDLTGMEVGDLFHFWVSREVEIPEEKLIDLVLRLTGVEFDCERRVVELTKTLSLELDVEDYSQKANAYLIIYFFAHKTRMFNTPGYAPYKIPKILALMPKVIDPFFCANISQEMIELIKQECIKTN